MAQLGSGIRLKVLSVLVGVAYSTSLLAQDTTSALSGKVVSASGSPLANVQIRVEDTRTGAVKTLSTNASGGFRFKGLAVGGPYTMTAEDDGASKTLENLSLSLSQPLNVTITLEENLVETVEVVGSLEGIVSENIGPSVNFSFDDLQNQPTVTRDIKDTLALDPRISIDAANSDAIQCGGANNRFNSITVDGIRQNDNFGLNNNGYPTERLPFPYDAIDQVSVQLSPFDVEYGGFTGCTVNSVIRSGSNEIHGSVFYDYTNDDLQGDELEGNSINVPDFNEPRYGFTIGGPIIPDKLFFFLAYEKHEPVEVFQFGPEDGSAANPIAGISTQLLNDIAATAQNTYGYTVGAIPTSFDESEDKYLAKINWTINESHRASFIFQNTDGNNAQTTDFDRDSFSFLDHFYSRENELTTYSTQFFSDWTENLSTEIKVGYTKVENTQASFTSDSDFGEFIILDANPSVDGEQQVAFGADEFRQANDLDYETTTFKLAGSYFFDEHEFSAGFEYESVDIFNLFVPGSQGLFSFATLEDFNNGQAERIEFNNTASLNPNDAAASFTFNNYTVYVQDEWEITDALSLTYGLRYDIWNSGDTPTANANFLERYGFSNAQEPDFDLLQPRIGVQYRLNDTTRLYGGLGRFAGGNPNVWLSNNFSNDGTRVLSSALENGVAGLQQANTDRFGFNVPQALIDGLTGGDGSVNAQTADFDVPSVWKFNLGVQREFGDGWKSGADFIFTKQENSAIVQAANTVFIGNAPDGRPRYRNVDLLDAGCREQPATCETSGRPSPDYVLTNSEVDGTSRIFSLFLDKYFDYGLNFSAGYAFSNAKEASPMNSSTASSNYGNLSVRDLNNPQLATSSYQIEHRFTLNLGYAYAFFGDYETRVNLFAQRVSGKPFSYTFRRDPGFGDARFFEDRNLLYIPSGPGLDDDPIVTYEEQGEDEDGNPTGFDIDAFNAFITDSGLDGSRGQILNRNSERSSWWTRVDLKFTQEFPGFSEEHRGTITFTIRNLGNLLNDDWGIFRQVNFEFNNPVVSASIIQDENGQDIYRFDEFNLPQSQSIDNNASLWSMRLGVNYQF